MLHSYSKILTFNTGSLGEIQVTNVVVKFLRTSGKVGTTGAKKGEYNEEIFKEVLGVSAERFVGLKKMDII